MNKSDLMISDIEKVEKILRPKLAQIDAMDKRALAKEFEKLAGTESHPRLTREWLSKAVKRITQDMVWIDVAGHIPADIQKKNHEFWMHGVVTFYKMEDCKEEKKTEKNIERVIMGDQTHKTVSSFLTEVDRTKMVIEFPEGKTKNPFCKNKTPLINAFFTILKSKGRMTYSDIEKWCSKRPRNPLPEDILLECQKHPKFFKFRLMDENGNLIEFNNNEPEEDEDIPFLDD